MVLSDKEKIVLRSLSKQGPTTVDEFVSDGSLYVNSWAPAFTHLRQKGLVVRTGEKRPTSHGSMAFVLSVTEDGQEWLAKNR